MFAKVKAALSALKAGESLKSSAGWKNVQTATNSVVIIITFLLTLFPDAVNMTDTDVQKLSGIIVGLVGLVNVYLIPATSKKVGLKTEGERK